MNKEIKQKWIEALRSGDYQQGQFRLRTQDNKFCCLGVLCDIYSKKFGVEWQDKEGAFTFIGSNEILPEEVSAWAEVDRNGEYDKEKNCLAKLNDIGKDFNYIANVIEEDL